MMVCRFCGVTIIGDPGLYHDEAGWERCNQGQDLTHFHEPTDHIGSSSDTPHNTPQGQ